MGVKLINIDDRLIHGQVATTWVKDYGIESIIIVDDAVSKDPVQKSVAGLAVPGIKVSIFAVDDFLAVLKKTEIKKVTMVLFTNPVSVLKCKKNGFDFSEMNVSGMRFNERRLRLHKNVSVTPEEKAAFDTLIQDENVKISMQTTTRDEKYDFKELLKNYKEN